MKSNGIIIAKDGSMMSFGTWVPRYLRDYQNTPPEQFHNDSFLKEVYPTSWWKHLNMDYDQNSQFEAQLASLAGQGLLIILNASELHSNGRFDPAVQITAPSTMSHEQMATMNELKEELYQIGNQVDFIDMVESVNGNYIDIRASYYKVSDFFEKEITPKLTTKNTK